MVDMVACIWNPSIPKVKWEAEAGGWPRCLKAKPTWNMCSSSTQGEEREEAGFSDLYTLIYIIQRQTYNNSTV